MALYIGLPPHLFQLGGDIEDDKDSVWFYTQEPYPQKKIHKSKQIINHNNKNNQLHNNHHLLNHHPNNHQITQIKNNNTQTNHQLHSYNN